jgi:pyruvate/2-oxoglutarate/acetoin dehydrogenase E1 component/TPP-dependent pyruvate/acetoin dehydrogenase alpha subunit
MTPKKKESDDLPLSPEEIIRDYRLAFKSRQASLIGRREVLSGKAKFGIFSAGKEVIQVALAHFFSKGDWRSGYYRDQTWMFANGMLTIEQFFAQLYAHADENAEPSSAGRSMNNHFSTRMLNPDGSWMDVTEQYNSSADVSPVGSQSPRLVGLAYASRLYRELEELHALTKFSRKGNEIAWGSIGNASAIEGMFWESINAIGVLQSPAVISIYDDGYGISVPNKYQMLKQDFSELLKGFQRKKGSKEGFDIYTVRGWNYPELYAAYKKASETARKEHVPAILHIIEVTQPLGHSTSGSHERYKSPERMKFEEEGDPIRRMRAWMVSKGIATEEEFDAWEAEDKEEVENIRKKAWEAFSRPIFEERKEALALLDALAAASPQSGAIAAIRESLAAKQTPLRRDTMSALHQALVLTRGETTPARQKLAEWHTEKNEEGNERYDSYLYSRSAESALNVPEVKPVYSETSPTVMGFEVLNACFDAALARDPRVIAFGEDVGKLGDVNQAFRGLQAKYGELRVSDTGIRELTIVGQAIGMAMRGLRPIAEIQYLDYLLYALQIMSDDLATVQWRTKGGQKAPAIIRTRGHRLEGIWHAGSYIADLLNLLRGMYVIVPRNMTQAAGFYNTMLRSDEPALIIEVLNGYRQKEKLPDNIGEFTVPLGVPEVIREGEDLTLVTYGALCRIAMQAAERLASVGIETEIIDVQTLLPFDLRGIILESLKKTNRILFVDEDMPGGATAYMMQQVIEKQGGYYWLDSAPRTLTSKPHRPSYGSDGDYWSKPNVESIFDTVYEIMRETDPAAFPALK